MKCPYCNKEISKDDIYCPYCGKKVMTYTKFIIIAICLFIAICVIVLLVSINKNKMSSETDVLEINELVEKEINSNIQEQNNSSIDIKVWDIEPTYEFDDIDVEFSREVYNTCYIEQLDPYGNFEHGGLLFKNIDGYGLLNPVGEIMVEKREKFYFSGPKSDIEYGNPNRYWVHADWGGSDIVNYDYTITETDQGTGARYIPNIIWNANNYAHYDINDGVASNWGLNDSPINIGYYLKKHNLLNKTNKYVLISNPTIIGEDIACVVYFEGDEYTVLNHIPSNKGMYLFSNGYILCCDREYKDGETIQKNYEYYSVNSNTSIKGYDDGYGFYEEYAAVKKDGKWGYIDKQGNVVIDFIFDKATPICDGKTWVIYQGKTGRINIKDMLDNNVPFDESILLN